MTMKKIKLESIDLNKYSGFAISIHKMSKPKYKNSTLY